jgi:hypothetical protein
MEQIVEITMDGFIDTMLLLRDRIEMSESEWDLLVYMVQNEMVDLSRGPRKVMEDFNSYAVVVEAEDFENKYPKYSSIMTWDEFVSNECVCGNENAAVVKIQ